MSETCGSKVLEVVRGWLLVLVRGCGPPLLLLLALSPDTKLGKEWPRLWQGVKGSEGMSGLR